MPDVRVPQKEGSIVVARDGDEPVTRHVTDHIVKVADDDLDHFLAVIDGATLVEAKPVSSTKEKP